MSSSCRRRRRHNVAKDECERAVIASLSEGNRRGGRGRGREREGEDEGEDDSIVVVVASSRGRAHCRPRVVTDNDTMSLRTRESARESAARASASLSRRCPRVKGGGDNRVSVNGWKQREKRHARMQTRA